MFPLDSTSANGSVSQHSVRRSLATGSAILALFLAGYLGQQYLPPPKPKVIGLDLGTTFCSVGVFLPGSGDVEVIADEEGRLSIPSCVSFTATAVLVGHEAAAQSERNPQNTIYDAKRFIGKTFEPGVLEQESARYPFKVGHPVWEVPAALSYLREAFQPCISIFRSGDQQQRKRRVPGLHQSYLQREPRVHRLQAVAEDEEDGRATAGRAHRESGHIGACRF